MKNLKIFFSWLCLITIFAITSCDDADIVCDLECLNGGVCISGDCYCPSGWTGEDCSELTDSTIIITDTMTMDTMVVDTTMMDSTVLYTLAGAYNVEVEPCVPASYTANITELADGTLEISNFRGDTETLIWTADANNLAAIVVTNQTLTTANGFEYTFSGVGDYDENTGIMNMTVVYTLFGSVETCEMVFTPQ